MAILKIAAASRGEHSVLERAGQCDHVQDLVGETDLAERRMVVAGIGHHGLRQLIADRLARCRRDQN